MNMFTHLTLQKSKQGIIWLTLDVKGRRLNVLTPQVLVELETAIESINVAACRGLILRSGKKNGFIAGADIKRFQQVEDKKQALSFVQRGHRLCNRLEKFECPTLALIDGFCLGAGLEVALACDYRIASEHLHTQIGFPQAELGMHPGFGGTVRTTRLIGALNALPLMLSGRRLGANEAEKLGLIDVSVPRRQLQNAAVQTLLHTPEPQNLAFWQRSLEHRFFRPFLAREFRSDIAKTVNIQHAPAINALINVWAKHGSSSDEMFRAEAISATRLILSDTAQNLMRVFFLKQGLKAQANRADLKLRYIHIVGAGLMGSDIALYCVLQGFRVSVQDTQIQALSHLLKKAQQVFAEYYHGEQRLIAQAMDRLIPDKSGYGIRNADVIIETIIENRNAKISLFRELEQKARADAVLATNTSSLPLTAISADMSDPTRLVGLHFFFPVMDRALVEVVHDKETQPDVIARSMAFAIHINKLPLAVKSKPGFLINRILLPYLIEGAELHTKNIPASVIDRAARDFGMPLGPLELADQVGLDVCLHVGQMLAEKLSIPLPNTLAQRVDQGHLGQKSGEGFYRYKDGKRHEKISFTERLKKGSSWKANGLQIQKRLVSRLVNEARKCLDEGIVDDVDLLDAGVIFGLGFAPFRGGPLHYLRKIESQKKEGAS